MIDKRSTTTATTIASPGLGPELKTILLSSFFFFFFFFISCVHTFCGRRRRRSAYSVFTLGLTTRSPLVDVDRCRRVCLDDYATHRIKKSPSRRRRPSFSIIGKMSTLLAIPSPNHKSSTFLISYSDGITFSSSFFF